MKRPIIMFVDDERDLLMGIARSLHRMPYSILIEDSGESALLTLSQNDIDVAVLDLKMPGIGGLELCKIMAREYPKTKIILLSGGITTNELIDAVNIGRVYKVLSKPASGAEIKAAIISALKCRYDEINKSHSRNDNYDPQDVVE